MFQIETEWSHAKENHDASHLVTGYQAATPVTKALNYQSNGWEFLSFSYEYTICVGKENYIYILILPTCEIDTRL